MYSQTSLPRSRWDLLKTSSIRDIKGKIVVGLTNHYEIYIVFEESVFKIPVKIQLYYI